MKENKRNFTYIVFVLYLFLLIWLVLFKLATNIDLIPHMRNINLIPFGDSVIVNGKIYFKEIIYNILAFVPFGVYLSIFKKEWDIGKKVLIGFSLSLLLEITQYVFYLGGSDITDLIGNTFGVFLGIGLFTLFYKRFKKKTVNIFNIVGLVIELCALFLLIILTLIN